MAIARAAGAFGFLARVEKWLGESFFRGVRPDHLHVLFPQLFRSLGCCCDALPSCLLPSPFRKHLRVTYTQWSLRSMSCLIARKFDPTSRSWLPAVSPGAPRRLLQIRHRQTLNIRSWPVQDQSVVTVCSLTSLLDMLRLFPARIRIESRHIRCNQCGFLTQILFIDHTILVDNKGLDTRRAITCRISD